MLTRECDTRHKSELAAENRVKKAKGWFAQSEFY